MTKFLRLFTFLPLLLWGQAWAACPARSTEPSVVINTADSGVTYIPNASLQVIMGAAANAGGTNVSPNLRGLTVVRLDTRMSISTAYMSDGKKLCAYPVKVDLFVGYSASQVVYILERYPAGTCQYNAVRAHENTHVQINTETLKALIPQLEVAMKTAVMHPGYPIEAPSKEWAQEAIRKSLSDLLRAYVDAHIQQRASLNGSIDTPESYALVQRLCPTW